MILGVGIDLFEVARLERELEGGDEGLLDSVFTANEIRSCGRRGRALAARFAAKEAVAKALALDGTAGLPWRQIEILDAAAQAPEVRLHGAVAEHAAHAGVRRIRVALAGDRRQVAAAAVAES